MNVAGEKKILLIGPMLNKKNPNRAGGTIVLFKELIDLFNELNVKYEIVDTNKKNYANKVWAIIHICFQLIKRITQFDHVSLHTSQDYKLFGSIIIWKTKNKSITTSLRKFGGDIKDVIENSNKIKKNIILWIICNIDFVFIEAKYLVEYVRKYRKDIYWFPNSRKSILSTYVKRRFNKRFIFIGHVVKVKGISELLEVSKLLDDSFTLHIFGPLINNDYSSDHLKSYNNIYQGALEPQEVIPTLNKYDVLILPSFHKEGYPGIILEAYSLGIPVIATNQQSIMEILKDQDQGLIIEPKNSVSLLNAIKFFNSEIYSTFSINAYNSFSNFDSQRLGEQFLNIILK